MVFPRNLKWLFLILKCCVCLGEFEIPDVSFKAFKPIGLKASIQALPGIELFAFHAKKNSPIESMEPGDIKGDVTHPTDGYFSYYNNSISLKPGDEIYYWIYVQHEQLGYRKEMQKWKVSELFEVTAECQLDASTSNCKILLDDAFEGENLNNLEWIWEQYIPNEPDFEFVNYVQDEKVTYLKDGVLHIKPRLIEHEAELKRTVDLTDGCTRSEPFFCSRPFEIFYQNPFTSGKITSKKHFAHSKVEIRAKLPKGDWIYPQIYLEDVSNATRKIWIAYSRGNPTLVGKDGNDIGSTMLFGGASIDEPGRSGSLSYTRSSGSFFNNFRKFSIEWTSNELLLFVDNLQYGRVDKNTLQKLGFGKPPMMKLVLGVGVGGISDFPDKFTSEGYAKPWTNGERMQIKNFYKAKDIWLKSWDNGGELVVDYVKIVKL